jgi:nucleoside phosphorylase
MPSAAFVGRVGGVAVALGVGASMITGINGAAAWADESGRSAQTTPSQSESTAGSDSAKSDAGTANGRSETPSAAAGSEPATSASTDTHSGVDQHRTVADRKSSKRSDMNREKPVSRAVTAKADKGESGDEASVVGAVDDTIDRARSLAAASVPSGSVRSAPSTHPAAVALADREADAQTSSPPPHPERTGVVSSVISGVVETILSPFAVNNRPGQPAGAPMVWSLLAFARREFESMFTPPSGRETPVDSVATGAPEQRTLILSAFPAEADAILSRTTLDPNPTVVVDGHHFYLGSMGGKKVIVAMTGIGMANATQTTEVALDHFTPASGISIGAVVFSGVAGGSGRTQIGSVAVPARWTSDDGETWHTVDSDMLASADKLTVDLESTAPLGDPFCSCNPFARFPLVALKREPQLFVGGDGSSDDNNNGAAFPAIPFGGDIFGPQPCTAPDRSVLFTGNFFQTIVPFLTNSLLSNLTGLLSPKAPAVDAVDQETAAAQQVAEAHGIPFLGIRGMSDGPGDPLNLPGYPFTFVVYRQLAADNAAIVTQAFLQTWEGP